MARPLRIEQANALYWVRSLGYKGENVFACDYDGEFFLRTLSRLYERFSVTIHSYLLMDQHFDLLIETRDANLSQFMKRLLGDYTIAFNRRHARKGRLFRDRYKSLLVEKDSYLLEISRYLHLAPVRAGRVTQPEAYRWSSMAAFLSTRAPKFLHRADILSKVQGTCDYYHYVLGGKDLDENPLTQVKNGVFLGSGSFIDRIRQQSSRDHKTDNKRSQAIMRIVRERLERVLTYERDEFKIYAYWKLGRMSQREIGERFSRTHSAISYSIKRFERKLEENHDLQDTLNVVKRQLTNFLY